MESQAFQTISELIGLPTGLQSTLALTLEDHWDLGLFKDLLQNPNGQVSSRTYLCTYISILMNCIVSILGIVGVFSICTSKDRK